MAFVAHGLAGAIGLFSVYLKDCKDNKDLKLRDRWDPSTFFLSWFAAFVAIITTLATLYGVEVFQRLLSVDAFVAWS